MALVDIEAGLGDAERAVLDTAHKFAEEVLRPAGQELDKLADPSDVVAKDSVLWRVFDKYRELGIDDFDAEEAGLEPIQAARLRAMISEEMGYGDAGLAISLAVKNFHRFFANMSGRPELIERYCGPESREIGCWAVTEPDHGSDSLAFSESHFRDPSIRANCIAKLDGDEYVINGQKAAWVSNGTIADVAALFCTIDGDQGFGGGGVAVVPLRGKGVSRGKPLDKLGQRALNQGEIFFDDVRIPASDMIIGKDAYGFVIENVLALANSGMGTIFVGVARAAFENALAYAKERVQGGVPIIEHQNVRARLFKMFRQVEAARSLARRVAIYNGTNPPMVQYSIAAKITSTSTAFEVANDALQIYGGNGLSREYPAEKLLRDARASMIEDGCNEMLSIIGGSKL
ncbi:MAG: acyl-CoA dehydrogenase family protein [Deltaproteobacteria bacterium]|nr:acyl-CoA dehydrogenase family protein [Deltaproteobacteria bacterium]